MYRHINSLKDEEWFNRPWIMLGTGPTLDNFNPKDWQDHNIIAIYDAFFACEKIDILFVSDEWDDYLYHSNYWNDSKNRYVATRGINAKKITDQKNIVMWDYDCDNNKRVFYDIDMFPCSNTSSFIVLWLGRMGVKEIKTFGIDGGKTYSKKVSKKYYDLSMNDPMCDPDIENQGVYGHADMYGIKLIKM